MAISRFRKTLSQIEEFAVDVFYDRRRGKRAFALGLFLYGLSLIFGFLARLRFFLYKKRILKDQPLGCLQETDFEGPALGLPGGCRWQSHGRGNR